MIYHKRARLRPRGGNEFYRDKSVRVSAAVCGGEMTSYDIMWREQFAEWTRPDGVRMIPCPQCAAASSASTTEPAKP